MPRRVDQCLQRIASGNGTLNAFIALDAEGALAAAHASDERARRGVPLGPLDGMPLGVKDNIDVAGLPAASGLDALRGRRPDKDAASIARLRALGAAFVGKTHMDEAALCALGDNAAFGRCHNPRRRGFTPGGSSSGSAAAVAAGFCVAALGTDTLGSVRIPASYCGVVGYVPSYGMIDTAGVMPLMPAFDRVGVLARSVPDAALVAAGMAECNLVIDASVHASIGLVRGLIGFVVPPIAAALEETARTLANAGLRIVEVAGNTFDWSALRRAAYLLIEVEAARVHAALLDNAGSGISAGMRAALEFGRRAEPERVARATQQVQAAQQALLDMLARCDLLLLPTTPQTAFPFDTRIPDNQADFTAPASIAGLAAISVPAGKANDLPIGVQLVGHDDARLLGVASRLS